MLILDAHCDILSKIKAPQELFSNNHHWDAKRASSNGRFLQVFSLFAEGPNESDIKAKMRAQLNLLTRAEKMYPRQLKIIKSYKDFEPFLDCESASVGVKPEAYIDAEKLLTPEEQVGCLIEAEGAEIIGDSLHEIDQLYDAGLRILTLCWNNDNRVCDSIAGQNTHNGLSPFGYSVVKRAQDLGIIIDVSHASDETFYDLAEITQKPFIASHSNCRAICSHRRNLTDEQIMIIAKNRGFIGINLYPDFLNNSGNAYILDIIKHIDYIASLVGVSFIGFGCDFDGVDKLPEDIKGVEDMDKIIEELLKLNYTEEQVKGIIGYNFITRMKVCLESGLNNQG